MNKETVHLISTMVWGIYGITVGCIGALNHSFNAFIMVTVTAAIVGNSAHLISMSVSQAGIITTAKP